MSAKIRTLLGMGLLAAAIGVASAQTTTDIQNGTVVATWDKTLVVRMPDGSVKQFDVPPGFQFDHAGQKVGLADLRPGWELTAKITTTTTPKSVTTTEIRNGRVVQVNGRNLIYQDDAGKNLSWVTPPGFKFMIDGTPTDVGDLTPGTKLTATIIRTSTTIESKKNYKVAAESSQADKAAAHAAPKPTAAPAPAPAAAAAPAPAPAPAAAAAPAPAPAAAPAHKKLPKTASQVPMVGLLGLLSLASGFGLSLSRRRSR